MCIRDSENTVAKYTIPAPAQTFQQMIVPANYERTRKIYATNEELIQDIGKAYQDVIQQFYDAGCRNLQFDDCTWGAIVGDAAEQRYQALGIDSVSYTHLDVYKRQVYSLMVLTFFSEICLEGMIHAESPECTPASSICSITAGTKACVPSLMASASHSIA